LDEASYVEGFVILNVAGGECLDDFGPLGRDGVRELIGHDLPSPEAARKFLYQFHDERLIEQAQQRLLPGQINYNSGEKPGSGRTGPGQRRSSAGVGAPRRAAEDGDD
jgi:hypothetical protein